MIFLALKILYNNHKLLSYFEHNLKFAIMNNIEVKTFCKNNGVVYTPKYLSDFLAKKALTYFFSNNEKIDFTNFHILDPACGKGELLLSSWNCLVDICFSKDKQPINPFKILCGVDIDQQAINSTINKINQIQKKESEDLNNNFFHTNSIISETDVDINQKWASIKRQFHSEDGFDIIIANPPWGADTSTYAKYFDGSFFKLLNGQFDTSDIFLELGLHLLKPHGILAFIIPDSIFSFERKNLRKFILYNSKLLFIARLGEGIFPKINRGSAIIILQKRKNEMDHSVECLRLDSYLRKALIDDEIHFNELIKNKYIYINQSRFKNNENFEFDIDISDDDYKIIKKINETDNLVNDFVDSFRGIEISKAGKITQCNSCKKWLPTPRENRGCPFCNNFIDLSKSKNSSIISDNENDDTYPIIVGSSIERFNIRNIKYIKTNFNGINYKDSNLYKAPKIVIRKTGVGITTAVNYSGYYTNQVVYSLKLKNQIDNDLILELIYTILNSRLLYFYIIKKFGETEWRSHPYLTLTQIRNLPLPKDFNKFKLSPFEIANLEKLRNNLTKKIKITEELDSNLEMLVARLYGMNKNDYERIYKTFFDIEQLIPVKRLLKTSPERIFSRN